ncbi:MAG: sigma-70 family RNA polymerase sigma factor, partial [Chloroflexi bacterium]|nr:sigma-70 family RNA polymerase sigma factor [Chloroflexota bacterium]
FLKMLESIHTFKWKGHPFTSWLYRIAHNQVVDNLRRKGRRQTVPLEDAREKSGVDASDLERAAEINVTMTEVLSAMDSLTDLQREVISLRFGSGLSVAETAQSVGRKDNAVKALQHAGLKKLRQAMVPVAPANFPVIEGDA